MSKDVGADLQSVETAVAKRRTDLIGQQQIPAVVESVLGSIGAKAFHNFQGTPMEVWRLTAMASGPDVIPPKEGLDQVIELTHFYCMQVQIAGPTPGEYNDGLRVVLIDKNGVAYGFTSEGVAKDLARIIATFGMGPYTKEPVRCKVVQFDTRLGRRAYSIQPA